MLLLITFFDKSKQLIKHHSQNTQDDNAEHHVIQSEDLAAVDNEIPQAGIGCQKFADNDTHQTEADIDFQVADDGGDACGQNNIAQNVPAGAAKGFDQQQFVAVNVDKGCIQIDNSAENGHSHTADNNGFHVISKPYNKDWGKSCFWQAVENYEIRFQNVSGTVAPPEQHGNQSAENQSENKADQGFSDGDADMIKETFICGHLYHHFANPCRAAENEVINQMASGGNFPSG